MQHISLIVESKVFSEILLDVFNKNKFRILYICQDK